MILLFKIFILKNLKTLKANFTREIYLVVTNNNSGGKNGTKKNRKKNIWVIIIPILIFIAFIGAGAYALRNSLIPTDHTRTNSSVQPTKTSVSNGYVEQKGVEAAVGSIALVDDAGVPK